MIVDPQRLERYGVGVQQVIDALAGNNVSFSGGFIERRAERTTVRGVGLLTGHADIEAVVITAVDGVPVLVRDVAEVRTGAMPRQGAVTRDGRGETVAGMVIMLKGENGREVGERAKLRIDEIQRSLPAGVTMVPFYDQTAVIDRTAATVRRNLIEGSLLVVAVLFFFLRDVRASLIVAAVIPLSMLCGFIGMRLFGVSANLMSLGAIDFGLIVDGAVVMMENFVRRRAEAETALPEDPAEASRMRLALFTSAAVEVARPILFGVLIIIAVYLPIFTLEGLEGKMFRPMAITVCSAIFGALLLALAGVPAAASTFLKMGGGHHEDAWFVRLRERYLRHLADAMRHRLRTIGVALVVVSVAIGSLWFIGTEFMPRLDEGAILIETRKLPVDLARGVGRDLDARSSRSSGRSPRCRRSSPRSGRPELATEAMGIYQGDVYVNLHPEDEWTTGRDKDALIEALAGGAEGHARRDGQLHAADGDAPRRGRLGRQGRRRGEDLRRGQRDARTAGRGGRGRARRRCRAWRTSRWRSFSGASQLRDDDRPAGHRALRPERRGRAARRRGGRGRHRRDRGARRPAADPRRGEVPRSRPRPRGGARQPAADRAGRREGAAVARGHHHRAPRRPRPSATRTASDGSSCRATCAAATSAASWPRRSSGWPR